MTDKQVNLVWYELLQTLETRLAARGETHKSGLPIQLTAPRLKKGRSHPGTHFPLHSIRVSLITALALEGKVPFPIVQKLAGHSRLLMTLYYTKPSAQYMNSVLTDAAKALEASKEQSIQNFLLNTEYDRLVEQAIANDSPSLHAAIPEHPANRNPAGWMPMHIGLCLVGGNTGDYAGDTLVGGCYNGGPEMGYVSKVKHAPVPGGSRNCVRCRWLVTEPHYLPALAAHFNNIAYRLDEARNASAEHEERLIALKKQRLEAEEIGVPFQHMDAYLQCERVWESSMSTFTGLAEDLIACWRLIDRCQRALEGRTGKTTQLIATGTITDIRAIFEETDSELLQLSGICRDSEIYPDLSPVKATLRRSQLLDSALMREDAKPFFLLLTESEQLIAGNQFIQRLAHQMNPTNPWLGEREVIKCIDAGESLTKKLGVNLEVMLHPERVTLCAIEKSVP